MVLHISSWYIMQPWLASSSQSDGITATSHSPCLFLTFPPSCNDTAGSLLGSGTLMLDFWASRAMGNKVLYKLSSLWDSMTAIQNRLRQKIAIEMRNHYYNKHLNMWKMVWNWIMGRGWKNLERKTWVLYCYEQTNFPQLWGSSEDKM